MRILHLISGLNDGGAEGTLYRLCTRDRDNRHMVVVMMDEGKYGPLLREAGIPVYCLNMRPGRIYPSSLLRLWRLLRQQLPDVVQTWMYHADLIGGIAARLAGIKQVFWNIRTTNLVSGKTKFKTIFISHLCARLSNLIPHKIICCAESSAKVHADLGYAKDKLIVVANGYDLSQLKPNLEVGLQVRKEFGIPSDAILLGMVGRFGIIKNHQNLLLALAGLAELGYNFYCLLVGTGVNHNNQKLNDWISFYGLKDYVYTIGKRNDIPAVMNAIDLHILSSSFGEGFPNVLAEAMSCGTPCVSTDVGDAKVIIGKTGWVVPTSDAQALKDAIITALKKREDLYEWALLRQMARQRVEDFFSLDIMVQSYRAVWNASYLVEGNKFIK